MRVAAAATSTVGTRPERLPPSRSAADATSISSHRRHNIFFWPPPCCTVHPSASPISASVLTFPDFMIFGKILVFLTFDFSDILRYLEKRTEKVAQKFIDKHIYNTIPYLPKNIPIKHMYANLSQKYHRLTVQCITKISKRHTITFTNSYIFFIIVT